MKSYVVKFSNLMPIGTGLFVEEEFLILADDITEAMVRGAEALDAVKEGFNRIADARQEPIRKGFINGLRLTKVEEEHNVLNPEGRIDQKFVSNVVSAIVKDLLEED